MLEQAVERGVIARKQLTHCTVVTHRHVDVRLIRRQSQMKRPKFVLSVTTRDSDYQAEQAAAAEDAARRLGIDLQVLYAENDTIEPATAEHHSI